MPQKTLAYAAALAALLVPARAYAIVVAADDSGDAAYNSGWATGTNGGSGFGAWTLRTTGGNAGSFQGNSDVNAGGDAFGLWASIGDRSAAYRAFNLTNGYTFLRAGDTFAWSMDNGGVDDSGSSVGLSLRTGNAASDAQDGTIFSDRRFAFEFQQGASNYKIIDSTGNRDTGIGWRNSGLHLSLTLTGADSYSLQVTDAVTSNTLGMFTGTFTGTAGAQINSLSIYNRFAGSGGARDAFFNNFAVNAVPEVSPVLAIPAALAIAGAGRAAWRRRRGALSFGR
ncbi:MAG: hypothetical protein DCC67_20410 [Planctomycetota bacterium]|nr:MAG: hypothetical protein DCC67_20410 [Planctomycetota bacterium]